MGGAANIIRPLGEFRNCGSQLLLAERKIKPKRDI